MIFPTLFWPTWGLQQQNKQDLSTKKKPPGFNPVAFNIPPRLKSADSVAVVATARAINPDAVNAGIEILSTWGLKVQTGKSLYQNHHLFAGTDQQRLGDLQAALDNREIKAIFCARGGYGTSRLLDSLNWDGFRQSPKWICGFSDVTSLLYHVHQMGYACLHSSMPQLFTKENARSDYDSL
jgi:muramoyltetrapeptide carboxypeptidase